MKFLPLITIVTWYLWFGFVYSEEAVKPLYTVLFQYDCPTKQLSYKTSFSLDQLSCLYAQLEQMSEEQLAHYFLVNHYSEDDILQ